MDSLGQPGRDDGSPNALISDGVRNATISMMPSGEQRSICRDAFLRRGRAETVKYSGVLASASPWRARIGPRPEKTADTAIDEPQCQRRDTSVGSWNVVSSTRYSIARPFRSRVQQPDAISDSSTA